MDSYYYWSSLAYGILCCLYIFIYVDRSHNRFLRLVFKILPLAIVFYTGFIIVVSDVAPFNIKGPFYNAKVRKVVFGLALSIVGHGYLTFPSLFSFGVMCFLGTHLLFFLSFSEDLVVAHVRLPEMIILLIIGVISISMYYYISKSLREQCGTKLGLLLYSFFMSLMLWTASLQALKFWSPINGALFAGAVLLYASDSMLAVRKWKLAEFPHSDLLIMSSFYASQYLICYSTVLSA